MVGEDDALRLMKRSISRFLYGTDRGPGRLVLDASCPFLLYFLGFRSIYGGAG